MLKLIRERNCVWKQHIKISKFWSNLNKYFTTSVVHSPVCARYVNLLPKYELSKFYKIEILKHFPTSFLNKIFAINNLPILAAYEILINYYIIKCTTNYMSMVNKTEIFFLSTSIFLAVITVIQAE